MRKNKIISLILPICLISGTLLLTKPTFTTNKNFNNKILLTQITAENQQSQGWINQNNNWYYFNNGNMLTGWQSINNTWYYMNNSGAMQTGWVNDNGTWYYMNNSGAMQTGWVNDNGTWYYMNNSGAMQTGWVNDNGTWYYMNNSGAMQTGWVNDNGTWYYMNNSGAMQTDWVNDNGTWYYLSSNGSMVTGNQTINGKNYTFNNNGAMEVIGNQQGSTANQGSIITPQYVYSSPTNNGIAPGTPGNPIVDVDMPNTSGLSLYYSPHINGTYVKDLVVSTPAILNQTNKITENLQTQSQKAKAIFDWISKNIQYNTNVMYNPAKYPASSTLNVKSGVCLDFAALYATMARDASIPVRIIGGEFNGTPHSWNQVYINGNWLNVDCTLGSCALNSLSNSVLSNTQTINLQNILLNTYPSQNVNGPVINNSWTSYSGADYFNNPQFNTTHSAQYLIYQDLS